MIEIGDVTTLRPRIGQEIAVGDWFEISQARIDQFADATGDHQWIHIDAARAAVESPFKATIAHGFLTLSLRNRSFATRPLHRPADGDQHGLNKVRCLAGTGRLARPRTSRPRRWTMWPAAVRVAWQVSVEREAKQAVPRRRSGSCATTRLSGRITRQRRLSSRVCRL